MSTWCKLGLALLVAGHVGHLMAASVSNESSAAASLLIDSQSQAKDVLRTIPAAAALERFAMVDGQGHKLAYVGLTDGDTGGVIFVDDKLAGVLDRRQAQAFYSCRGFATANQQYWGRYAVDWTTTLLQQMKPASSVQLIFSGKSTLQSIKSIVDNPLLGQVKSLLDMGSNPINILKTLNRSRTEMREKVRNDELISALAQLEPGDDEGKLAAILMPQDVNFLGDDVIMAYPRFSVDYLVQRGRITMLQQPSFLQLSRGQAALFYRPGVSWSKCNPAEWPATAT